MNRKLIAQDTLRIIQEGAYSVDRQHVSFADLQAASEANSRLYTPEQGQQLVRATAVRRDGMQATWSVANEATVKAVRDRALTGQTGIGVLNFASAKNPGGGFLNGAMAQEESLAASSGLYQTQLCHETYYEVNRRNRSMMYTDYAIYSPDVVFFRDERFALVVEPVTASVLTLPAVNYGQVLLKGEDSEQAKRVMKDRMRLALVLFAAQGDQHLILGAYGCGVFRNDPVLVAAWWHELLVDEAYGTLFADVHFAVLDTSKSGTCIRAFEEQFGTARSA